jgi:TfoX/Sxy family transcriptional regulator of competence genes
VADATYAEVVHELTTDPAIVETKMMGMPSLKREGILFAGSSDENLVVKIGRERVDALLAAGSASPFDPSGRGRPMKDWAVIAPSDGDWIALAEEAKRYATSGGA